MPSTRRTLSVLLLAVGLGVLPGCVSVVATPVGGDRPTVRPTPIAPQPSASASGAPGMAVGASDCGGADVAVQSGADATLTGECPTVTVSGADIDVDLTRAVVGTLIIGGDRNDVDAGALRALQVAGQENDVDASEIGAVQINGDRNEVDADGAVGAVSVSGNDNTVEGSTVGEVTDNGARNVIRADS